MNKSSAGKPIGAADPFVRRIMEALDADPRSMSQLSKAAGYTLGLYSKMRVGDYIGKFSTVRNFAEVAGLKFVIVPMGVMVEDAVYDPEEG